LAAAIEEQSSLDWAARWDSVGGGARLAEGATGAGVPGEEEAATAGRSVASPPRAPPVWGGGAAGWSRRGRGAPGPGGRRRGAGTPAGGGGGGAGGTGSGGRGVCLWRVCVVCVCVWRAESRRVNC